MTYCKYCEKETEDFKIEKPEEADYSNFIVISVYCTECNAFKYQYLTDLYEE